MDIVVIPCAILYHMITFILQTIFQQFLKMWLVSILSKNLLEMIIIHQWYTSRVHVVAQVQRQAPVCHCCWYVLLVIKYQYTRMLLKR